MYLCLTLNRLLILSKLLSFGILIIKDNGTTGPSQTLLTVSSSQNVLSGLEHRYQPVSIFTEPQTRAGVP